MHIISISSVGGTGNRMFQYLFCRMLQFHVPQSVVCGFHMPIWGLSRPRVDPLPGPTMVIRDGHRFDVGAITSFLNETPDACLDFGGYAQRLEYLGPHDLMAALFPPLRATASYAPSADDLIINIRGAEIINGLHADYGLIPISFYERLIAQTGLKPVFMGQLGDDGYSNEIRRRFSGGIFLDHVSAEQDYAVMNAAINIVVSVSTFSWMASWLSPVAKTIHMPVLGFYNPGQRPDVDLLPRLDKRYRFYDFPVRPWRGTPEDLAWAIS